MADVLFFTGSLFLLGLSLYGFWVCEIFVFAKAMTFGMLASACYCLNGGKGAMIVATVILPYAFLILTVLCLFCTEATDLSYHVDLAESLLLSAENHDRSGDRGAELRYEELRSGRSR